MGKRVKPRQRGRAWHIAMSCILTLLVVVPLVVAVLHEGFPATDVNMRSRDVWVTNSGQERAGRLNAQISELDASVSLDSKKIDVLQNGDDVFVVDQGAGTIGRVDPMYTDLRERIVIPAATTAAFNEETLAILETSTGKLWVLDTSGPLTFDASVNEPTLQLGQNAQVVVTHDGAVLAVDTQKRELVRIPEVGADPVRSKLEGEFTDFELTSVGDQAAVLDRTANRIMLEDGVTVALDQVASRIQLPGPERDHVVVANAGNITRVPLGGGEPTDVTWPGEAGTATDRLSVAQPAVVGTCVYGAWAATGQVVATCDDAEPVVSQLPPRNEAGELKFRVNQDIVALNDLASGNVWLPQENLRFVENWLDTVPPEDQEGEDGEQDASEQSFEDTLAERTEENHAPQLLDDEFGVRAGQASYLPVLDNDTDPDGDLINIVDIQGKIPESIGRVEYVDEGRALQFHAAEGASGEITFTYVGSDGRPNGVAQARVTLRIVTNPAENQAPTQRHKSAVSVEAGQQIRYNVLGDWQDPEGDPIYLLNAAAPANSRVSTSPDGFITFGSIGAELGDRLVTYVISDGVSQTTGELAVTVVAPGTLSPVATPDFASGVVNETVVVRPLENDLSPSGGSLKIVEVSELAGGVGGMVFNDARQTISYRASSPGSYYVQYTVRGGKGETKGLIRFDIAERTDKRTITPVRDLAYLRPSQTASLAPLLNDHSTSTDVLAIQKVDVTDEARIAGLSVELLDNTDVRISSQNALKGPIDLTYTVTDGHVSADGLITVLPIEAAVTHSPPIAMNDSRSVRVGDYATVDVLANDVHPDGDLLTVEPTLTADSIGDGYAFVADNKVRFQAPSKPGTYIVDYVVSDENGEQAGARVSFDVKDLNEETNQAPTPTDEVARVFEGASVRIKVPLSGVDPDGDSVTFVGVNGLPTLGSIVEQDETSFLYEAFEGSAGTDELRYEVVDTFGARGTGTIRIGVVQRPETTAPPVAVDDVVDARPDSRISVPVLENDSDPNGYPIELVQDISGIDPALRPELDGSNVILSIPADEEFVSAPYSITNGQGGSDDAYIHVRVTDDAREKPPAATDHVVALESFNGVDFVDVNLRKGAYNPSGRAAELRVDLVGANKGLGELVEDGTLRVRVTDRRQVIAYQVTDPVTELTAAAFVMVPARITEESKRQSPYLRTDLPEQRTDVNKGMRWNVNDIVVAPSGLPVKVIEPESAWAEQSSGGQVVVSENTVQFQPKPGFRGPASITFLVSDAQGPDDKNAGVATIRVPITVGDPNLYDVAPTFVTPQMTVPVGTSKELDLRSATGHPNPDVIGQVQYSGLKGGGDGVTLSLSGSTVTVDVIRQAKVGTVVKAEITYAFRDFVQTGTINITITSSPLPPPRVVEDAALGIRGQAVTLDVLANDFNPYPDVPLKIVNAQDVSAERNGADISVVNNQIVFTPDKRYIGEVTVKYTVRDDTGDPGRDATGYAKVRFRDRPEVVPAVRVSTEGRGSIQVSWDPPASNGERIVQYEVVAEAVKSRKTVNDNTPLRVAVMTTDAVTSVTLTPGEHKISHNREYQVSVRAMNAIGWGDFGRSQARIQPVIAPDQPSASGVNGYTELGQPNGTVTVNWEPPRQDGGEITGYRVELVSPPSQKRSWELPANQASLDADVHLEGGNSGQLQFQFIVYAKNRAGESASNTVEVTLKTQPFPQVHLEPLKQADGTAAWGIAGRDFVKHREVYVVCAQVTYWTDNQGVRHAHTTSTGGTQGIERPLHTLGSRNKRILVYTHDIQGGNYYEIGQCKRVRDGEDGPYQVWVFDAKEGGNVIAKSNYLTTMKNW